MSEELSISDVEKKVVKRDSNGEILPEEHTIDWYGEEKTVKTHPITTGLVNELSHVDEGIANLEPEAVHEAFQVIYVTKAIRNLRVEQIADMEVNALNSLLKPLEDEVDANFDGGEGNPKEMSRGERARQMR